MQQYFSYVALLKRRRSNIAHNQFHLAQLRQKLLILSFMFVSLVQGWGMCGPRVACGPLGHLEQPALCVMNTIKLRPAKIYIYIF